MAAECRGLEETSECHAVAQAEFIGEFFQRKPEVAVADDGVTEIESRAQFAERLQDEMHIFVLLGETADGDQACWFGGA